MPYRYNSTKQRMMLWKSILFLTIKINLVKSSSIRFEEVDHDCEMTYVANIDPPLGKGKSHHDRLLVDSILEYHWHDALVYTNMMNQEEITETEKKILEKRKKELTYGEVTSLGIRQLIHEMGIQNDEKSIMDGDNDDDRDDVILYDLGSGVGRLVVQIFLEVDTIHKVVGIELSERRHSLAMSSWEAVKQSLDITDQAIGIVDFRNEDILQSDFSDATHIYISSLCFPIEVIETLSTMIIENSKKGFIKVVAALSDLKLLESGDEAHRWDKRTREIQMTWGRSLVRFYTLIHHR